MVYRDFKERGDILNNITYCIEGIKLNNGDKNELSGLLHEAVYELIDLGANNGFYGNLWHCYLTDLLVNNENAYTKATEIRGDIEGSLNMAVLNDIAVFKQLYDYDLVALGKELGVENIEVITEYEPYKLESKVYNGRIQKRICDLTNSLIECKSAEEMKDCITQFYKEFGVGKFGLHKAFRVEESNDGIKIVPILKIAHVKLDDLVGYEIAKNKLRENTEAFVQGRKANNCLLYGDAGTGKSSSIKAIANEYYDEGLRIIEVYKHQFKYLNDVIAQIKSRNYKFIIYMDDLSFEDFEIEYKYLKAVIEGGLEKKPENILIYATSNRRHLVRERFTDKEDRDDDLHTNDTVQEKLSLASRFGVSIYFESPDKKEFQNIVKELAIRNNIDMDEETLLLEANKWELMHSGRSGRTAQQFIDHLLSIS